MVKRLLILPEARCLYRRFKGDMHKRITNTAAPERFVSFSPDGKKIIYASERDAKWSIYETSKVNADEPYFFVSTLLKRGTCVGE
jgi:tricorn protease